MSISRRQSEENNKTTKKKINKCCLRVLEIVRHEEAVAHFRPNLAVLLQHQQLAADIDRLSIKTAEEEAGWWAEQRVGDLGTSKKAWASHHFRQHHTWVYSP